MYMYKQCETSIIQSPIIRTLVRNFAIFLLDLGDVAVHVNYAELRLSINPVNTFYCDDIT